MADVGEFLISRDDKFARFDGMTQKISGEDSKDQICEKNRKFICSTLKYMANNYWLG